MKNYTITVNGTVYDVSVEEGSNASAAFVTPAIGATTTWLGIVTSLIFHSIT